MADIVPTIFSLTPETYQQTQAAQAEKMALQYAQLTPMQQAQFSIGRGAYQLAGALGGQDPQLRMISTRNAIAQQIDYTNPESMSAGIQALSQAGDTVGAIQLSQVLRQMQSEMAQRQQRLAAAGASEAAAAASRAAAERDRTPESLLRARRRGEITRLLGRPSELTAEDVQALEAEARSLMSKEELEAEEVRRQAAGFQAMIGGAQAPATRAAAEPGLMEDLASMGVFAPSQAPSITAQPAATAETGDLAAQLAQAREEFNRVSRFPKVPEAVGRAAQLKPIIENLEKRLVNVRLDDQYRAFLAANPNSLQAPAASLPAREQLAARQAQLTRISDLAASGSPLAKRDEDFIKEEIKALRTRIGKEEEPFNAGELAERISREKFNGRPFRDLRPSEAAVVNRLVEEAKERNAPKIIMPGQPVPPKDWLQFENFIEKQPTFKRTAAVISAAPGVLRVIRQSTSNDFASAALPINIARLFDEGTLSNVDVATYAQTGGLDNRLANMASRFFTGRLTSVTKKQAEEFMTAVYRGALLDQRKAYETQARRLGYANSPNYTETLRGIDEELAKFREVKPETRPTPPAESQTAPAARGRTGNPLVDKYLP